MNQVLPDRVGRSLIPGGAGETLFRRQDFHEPISEVVKFVTLRDVPVERSGVELGQKVHPLEPGVEAIRDGDIDQPIFANQGHRRFGALLGQRKEACALSAAHDDGKGIVVVGGRAIHKRMLYSKVLEGRYTKILGELKHATVRFPGAPSSIRKRIVMIRGRPSLRPK